MSTDGARRSEILETAASLFASSGLRTSLKEIADACGILPGSLYHHFESKEAIILELVQRYLDDLDRVAADAMEETGRGDDDRPVEARIIALGRAIAACGVRHRAALLLTLYEPPAVFGDELARLASKAPTAIGSAMLGLLRHGAVSGAIRPGIDLTLLSDRLCQSMLHIAVGVSHMGPGADEVPDLRLRIVLHGVGRHVPSNTALDRSPSVRSVQAEVAAWDDPSGDDDRTMRLRAVARREFGRRGYEATTMRDIAAAAELSTGAVYRSFASKDELLVSIMSSYAETVKRAWDAALRSGTPLEKLDGLMWANIQLLERFSDEFKIQLAWLRQSPPSTPDLGLSFLSHLRQIKALLAEGARAGDIHVEGSTVDVRARCVYEAVMFPPSTIGAAGVEAVHGLARDTVLRGALRAAPP